MPLVARLANWSSSNRRETISLDVVGLVEIDDVDAAARAVDVLAHLRVPALRLVTEVDTGLEELANAERLRGVPRGTAPFDRRGLEHGLVGDRRSGGGLKISHESACSFRLFLRPAVGKPGAEAPSTEPNGRAPGRVVFPSRGFAGGRDPNLQARARQAGGDLERRARFDGLFGGLGGLPRRGSSGFSGFWGRARRG